MNKIVTVLLACFLAVTATAQSNFGKMQGKVTDAKTKAPIAYATILLEKDGIRKGGAYTDDDGKYVINALDPGVYSLTVKYSGYQDKQVTDIEVASNSTKYLNVEIAEKGAGDAESIGPVVIRVSRTMIEKDKNSQTITSKDIANLPTRNLNAIAATSSAANQTNDGQISFLGSRADATAYFVDGVRVLSNQGVPQSAQGQIEIIQSGIPAQYGDFTGGAISITTKGPSRAVFRSFELISSSPFDPYHFNQAEFSASGPLWIKNKGGGDKEYVALGYQFATNIRYDQDANPRFGGFYSLKDESLADIEATPLTENPKGDGFVYRSNFITQDDLEFSQARRNVAQILGNFQGKLEYQPNKNATITAFGSYRQDQGNNWSFNQSLMNFNEFSYTTNQTLRTYLKFTQRLGNTDAEDKEKEKPLFSDAYYTIRLDYQSQWAETINPEHGENFFDYGHVGRFVQDRVPVFAFIEDAVSHIDQNGDTVRRQNFLERQQDRIRDISFEQGDKNIRRGTYSRQLFEFFDEAGLNFFDPFQVQSQQGLLNGFAPGNTYSLWTNPGAGATGYSKSQTERAAAYAQGEAILNLENTHDLQFGMYFEQTFFSNWGLNAAGLWQLMPQLANSHLSEFERTTDAGGFVRNGQHTYDEFGTFTDTVDYRRRIDADQQKSLDRNLRQKLIDEGARDAAGRLYTDRSFIDINSLDPSMFSLDMFSADDLWNNGNSFVGYYGYDYLGNRTRRNFSINDFTNDDQEKNIGSFAPIYNAIWLQDKFQFKDLILRIGVRVERYDANQIGLLDQYSLFPTVKAGELSSIQAGERGDGLLNGGYAVPGTVGDDYVVYVNNIDNPTQVLGYRNENTWYDAQGVELPNSDVLAQEAGGRIQPFLESTDERLQAEAFQDYEPVINVLPRIWFSFPINSEAQFFANYDKLAQRPQNGAIFAPINRYDFLEENQGSVLPNANLQPRVTTNYELGFKQTLTRNSALSLIAAYRQVEGDYALVRLNNAYPISYNSYQNLDFSTIKSFRAEYELRGQGRTSLGLNYTLLFADGTGSNINSALALINANQPNLRSLYPTERDVRHKLVARFDYRFKGGNDYTGPIWFNKKVFENFGANLIITSRAGQPFTAYATPVPSAAFGVPTRQLLDGNPFGSNLPWQTRVDANFSKSFSVKKKNVKDQYRPQTTEIQVFLWVQNLLNTRNIQNVYGFTRSSTDDGWLSSPEGQQQAANEINTQSYVDLYNAKVDNPFFYDIPRLTRLGVRFYF